MGIKKYNPKTPSQRWTTILTRKDLDKKAPERSLVKGKHSTAGRGAGGRIAVRRRGGGHKQKNRLVDFKRDKIGVPGVVTAFEYDPNRSSRLALIFYKDGDKRYILAPQGLQKGATVVSGPKAAPEVGNALPLENVPLGMAVHNIELTLGRGGQLVRSAGGAALVVAKEGDYVTLRMPSGETRLVNRRCIATIGTVGNEDHMNVSLGKAGRSRWKGNRPKVRGEVMNPVDHPHGGRTHGGRHPVSPWGQPAKGYKTRNKRKLSDKFIVSRRRK